MQTFSSFVRAVLRTVMANDPNITTLSLAGLSISRRNAKHLAKAMSQNSTVQTLDLSNKGTDFDLAGMCIVIILLTLA